MPIDLTIHPAHSLSYFRFSGNVAVQDCAGVFRRYLAHPQFDPDHVMLSNAEQLLGIDATFLGIMVAVERLVPSFIRFPRPSRSVILAPGDVPFGMARMMQQVTEPISRFKFDICRTEEEALIAAGLSETSIQELEHNLGLLAPAA